MKTGIEHSKSNCKCNVWLKWHPELPPQKYKRHGQIKIQSKNESNGWYKSDIILDEFRRCNSTQRIVHTMKNSPKGVKEQ